MFSFSVIVLYLHVRDLWPKCWEWIYILLQRYYCVMNTYLSEFKYVICKKQPESSFFNWWSETNCEYLFHFQCFVCVLWQPSVFRHFLFQPLYWLGKLQELLDSITIIFILLMTKYSSFSVYICFAVYKIQLLELFFACPNF